MAWLRLTVPLALVALLACRSALAGIVFSHAGDSDPVNNHWVVNQPALVNGTRPSSGPIADDAGTGLAAWYIDDNAIEAGTTWFYEQDPDATQVSNGQAFGWTLRARVRVVDIPDDPSTGSVALEYANGTTTWRLNLGSDTNGDPVAQFDGGGSVTVTGAGSGYHLYEMVYDPAAGSVDLFIDGVERISNFAGVASTLFTRVIWGSASSGDTGQGNWNLVEWEINPAPVKTRLRMQTDVGGIDLELFDDATPATVANFMNYVNRGAYDGSFIHRSVPGFVVQMGGFVFDPSAGTFFGTGQVPIPEDPPVVNEPGISNVRATIAMAKIPATDSNGNPIPGGGPDSATDQFFFNLADNSGTLDSQNGGFTVFGQVAAEDMPVVDAIAGLPTCYNQIVLCGNNTDTPIVGLPVDPSYLYFDAQVMQENIVTIYGIGPDSDGDGVIDRIEDAAPNNGDGNNDGVSDSTQANIASFRDFRGAQVRLEAAAGVSFRAADILGPPFAYTTYTYNSVPALIDGYSFGEGYFGFGLDGVAPGGSTRVTLKLPADSIPPDNYFNYGPTVSDPSPHWYSFLWDGTTGAQYDSLTNTVTLTYVDGARGDADLDGSNGIVAVPGGPASKGDSDGIPDLVEAGAANGGDGNKDGIPDRMQDNVGSLPDIIGNYLTVAADPAFALDSYQKESGENYLGSASPPSMLSGLNFSNGFLSVQVHNVAPNTPVQVKMILPAGEHPVRFFMYGPTPDDPVDHLYEFTDDGQTGAQFVDNTVILTFRDGERGDADLTVNGTIAIRGAPALAAAVTVPGGGGGCTLSTAARKPAQAADWLIVWISLPMLVFIMRCRYGRMA